MHTCCKNKPSPSLSTLALAINLIKMSHIFNAFPRSPRPLAHSSMCASTVVIDGLKLLKASLQRSMRCNTWSADPACALADCLVLTREAP